MVRHLLDSGNLIIIHNMQNIVVQPCNVKILDKRVSDVVAWSYKGEMVKAFWTPFCTNYDVKSHLKITFPVD